MARPHVIVNQPEDSVTVAVRQAARERRKGHHRRAMLLLQRAAFEARESPGLWTRYALSCMSDGKIEEGKKAFAQAVWLNERTGRRKTAELTKRLAADAACGTLPAPYRRKK